MSHYSDIGFELFNPQDSLNIFNLIHSNEKIERTEYNIPNSKGIVYALYKFGEIRYSAKLNYNTHQIRAIALGHNNENASECKYIKTIKGNSSALDFDTIMVEKDGIPFWFCCPNIEIDNVEKYQDISLRIASFADTIEIKDLPKNDRTFNNPEELREYISTHNLEMAEESYIANFESEPSYAFVSGIITNFKLEKNIFTEKEYYSIDFDCLGLHFKALVDTKLINEKDLQIGIHLSAKDILLIKVPLYHK